MRSFCWSLALPLLVGRTVHAWSHISAVDLQNALESSGYTLVAFVMPKQAASKALEPEWKEIQTAAKDEAHNIISIDCAANLKTCKDLDVVSYPAVRLYHRDGRVDRFRGPRKAASIMPFLHRALRPTIFEVNAATEDTFLTSDEVVFVAHFTKEDTSAYARYQALAKRYRDRFAFGMGGAAKETSTLKCRNNIDDEEHSLNELWRVEAYDTFVRMCAEPLIPELVRKNEEYYSMTGKSILHYFTSTEKEKDQYRDSMRDVAKKYRDFLHFTITDVNEYGDILPMLGLKKGMKTGLSLQNPNTGEIFPYKSSKKLTPAAIEKFLDDVIDGRIEPWEGSQLNQFGGMGGGTGHDEL